MSAWKRGTLVIAVALCCVTGCSSGGSSAGVSVSTTPRPAVAPFTATVALTDFSATCSKVVCWLPTQWAPKLVDGETVSLRDKWPMDGMTVLVVCQTTGETYRDQLGQNTDAWYGILVPTDKLEPLKPGTGPRSLPINDGYIGYVGAAWIKTQPGEQAPSCQTSP